MSDKRKPSGCEYRKRARERNEREGTLMSKVPKLDMYFSKPKTTLSKNDCHDESLESLLESDDPEKSDVVISCERENGSQSEAESSASVSRPIAALAPATVSASSSSLVPTSDFSTPSQSFKGQLPDYFSHHDNVTDKVKEENKWKHFDDPALWEINEELREFIAMHGITQNDDGDFSKSVRQYSDQKRLLSKNIFYKKLVNGEDVKMCYLVYSKSTGRVYCAPCKLYGGSTALGSDGFNDWKNSHIIQDHDNNAEHRECLRKYLARSMY